MLKKFRFLTLSFLVFLFVYGCSDVQETNKGEFKAEIKRFLKEIGRMDLLNALFK